MVRKYVDQQTGRERGANADVVESVRLWVDVGNALSNAGMEDDAIAVFKATLEYAREKFTLRLTLARIYMNKGNYKEAINEYLLAIGSRPLRLNLWMKLCEAYLAADNIDGGIAECRANLTTNNPACCFALSRLYVAKRDYQGAIATQQMLFTQINKNFRVLGQSAFYTWVQSTLDAMCGETKPEW